MRSALYLKGEAEFAFDGDTYMIVLDVNAWLTVEAFAPGVSIIDLTRRYLQALEAGRHLPVADLAPILAAGLEEHHPGANVEMARDMILSTEQASVLMALNSAMWGSLPISHQEGDDAPKKVDTPGNGESPENGTGKRSSRAGAAPGSKSKGSGKAPRA